MGASEYEVELAASARRDLYRLPVDIGIAIMEHVEGPIAGNPRRLGKQLEAPYAELWSARRSEYRVLYVIDDHARVLTVVAIRHRRDAYR